MGYKLVSLSEVKEKKLKMVSARAAKHALGWISRHLSGNNDATIFFPNRKVWAYAGYDKVLRHWILSRNTNYYGPQHDHHYVVVKVDD